MARYLVVYKVVRTAVVEIEAGSEAEAIAKAQGQELELEEWSASGKPEVEVLE